EESGWPRSGRASQGVSVVVADQSPEAALALLERFYGLQQLGAAKVGPEGLGDVDLGVGDLPQQEIAQPHLAAGANDQVELGQAVRIEMVCDALLVHLQMFQAAISRCFA